MANVKRFNPKTFELYCRNESCGDRVLSINGEVFYIKRKMNYAGVSFWLGNLIYLCPVCGALRKFSYDGGSINEL